ncbi:phage holin family protein [Pseudocitrobacter faecalis]|uniref:phage holin family protein n=1 Tax=Pseudocitrobacter faecalis TaxID=1398493 RepID=UPI003BA2DC15
MNSLLQWTECVSCILIALRVLTYRRRPGARYRPFYSFLAWLIITAAGTVALRIIFGVYHRIDWAGTLLTVLFCISILLARGNVAKAITSPIKPEVE